MGRDKDIKDKIPFPFNRAKSVWGLILLFSVIAILHFSSINGELNGLGGDNAGYILLAKSLSGFDGYRNMSPGYPPGTHWPPLFPLMLVPAIWAFGIKMEAFHFVVVSCEFAALVFLYRAFKRTEGTVTSLLACVLFALNPFINLSLVRILSEFPYLMFTTAAILVSLRAEDTADGRQSQLLWLPLLVVACYMTRIAGLSMLAALILYRIYRRQWKILAINSPLLLLPYAGWELRKFISDPGGFSYFSRLLMKQRSDPALGNVDLGEFINRVIGNIELLARSLVEFVLPFAKQAGAVLIVLIIAVTLMGLAIRWRRGRVGLMEFYVVVYVGMLLVWPVFEPRKVMPVVPFLFLYIFVAITWIAERLPWSMAAAENHGSSKWYQAPAALLIACAVVLSIGQIMGTKEVLKIRSMKLSYPTPGSTQYSGFTIDWSHFRETYYWVDMGIFPKNADRWSNYLYLSRRIGEISPPDTAVIARKGTLTALFGQRPAKAFPFSSDFDVQREYILDNEIDYVLFDGMFRDTGRYMLPFVQKNKQAFRIVERKGNAFLLKVDRSKL